MVIVLYVLLYRMRSLMLAPQPDAEWIDSFYARDFLELLSTRNRIPTG